MINRYLADQIKKDLKEKMVIVAGPRQVGKTTLAKSFLQNSSAYLNWDIARDREKILSEEFPLSPLIVLDEIHKYRKWRNYLKGLYDDRGDRTQLLVTGSAKLDVYRFGGDSLQGRYHFLRFYPLTVAELKMTSQSQMLELLSLNGFPEPFFKGNKVAAQRWSTEYRSRLLYEELKDLETISDIGQLELLMLRLPDLVGRPLSINKLSLNLQTSHKTISRWVDIFEKIYAVFRVPPFGAPRIRAVKKEQKHYHMDWSLVSEEGVRFENMVAVHLLKWIAFEKDVKGRLLELRYFRDVDGRETDFVITEKMKPIQFIECKWNDRDIDTGLLYLKSKFPDVEAWQISATGKKDYQGQNGIRVAPALVYLKNLL